MPIPRKWLAALFIVVLACGASGCATTRHRTDATLRVREAPPQDQVGIASFYARAHHGWRTASGERFDMNALTAAHRTYPFGTRVRVTNLENGRDVVVRINDRGPFGRRRIIDVSYAAARELGLVRTGLARVRVERI